MPVPFEADAGIAPTSPENAGTSGELGLSLDEEEQASDRNNDAPQPLTPASDPIRSSAFMAGSLPHCFAAVSSR